MFRFDLGLAGASGACHFPPFDRLHVPFEGFVEEGVRNRLLREGPSPIEGLIDAGIPFSVFLNPDFESPSQDAIIGRVRPSPASFSISPSLRLV